MEAALIPSSDCLNCDLDAFLLGVVRLGVEEADGFPPLLVRPAAAAAAARASKLTGAKANLGALPINMDCIRWSAAVAVLMTDPGTHLSHL